MAIQYVTDKVINKRLNAQGFDSDAQAQRCINRCERHLLRDEANPDVPYEEIERRYECIEDMRRLEADGDSAIRAMFDFWGVDPI